MERAASQYGSTSAQLSAAQCDLAKAGDYSSRVLAATAKPDIPAGAAIYVPSTGGKAASPIREWSLVQQPGPCSQGWTTDGTITFGLGDGAWEWGFGSLDGDLVNRFGVPDCDLRTDIAVGSDKGDWKVPTAADLAALFSGHSQPGAWLTSALGFHDLSGTASLLPPPPYADVVNELRQTTTEKIGGGGKSNVPHTVTHHGYSTFANPGTTYSVWTSECTDTGVRYPGFYAPSVSSDPTQTDYLKAYFCTTVRLADGVTSDLCLVTESPYHPCNWPVISEDVPTVGSGCPQPVIKGDFAVGACGGRTSGRVALDYGHDAALLAWRAPSAEQYWYSP